MMKSPVYFSVMDHTHILQGGNMPTVSAAPRGLCEICRGCVGDRHILFDVNDTGNKTNPSRQTVWWLRWHTIADHCDERRRVHQNYTDNINVCFCHSKHECKFYKFDILDTGKMFWFKHHRNITQCTVILILQVLTCHSQFYTFNITCCSSLKTSTAPRPDRF